MKKLTVLIMVLGLASGVQTETWLLRYDNPAPDNISFMASSAIAISIQYDDSVCIVYLEPTEGSRQWIAPVKGDTFSLFPDVTTIASLGFVGLLLRRRRTV